MSKSWITIQSDTSEVHDIVVEALQDGSDCDLAPSVILVA